MTTTSIAQRWGLNPEKQKTASEQYQVLRTCFSRPDAGSDRYELIHDIPWHDGTVHRQISGVHLVVDRSKEPWKSLHDEAKVDGSAPRLAVSHLDIFCDTLEITSRLCLPQVKVRIFARRLRFADRADAVLSTSANPWRLLDAAAAGDNDARGADGLHGRNGGEFQIFVKELQANNTTARLLAAGCDGQNAGRGMNGAPGTSVNSIRHLHEEFSANLGTQGVDFNFEPEAVYFSFRWNAATAPSGWCGGLYSDLEYGIKDRWPSSGSDAIPAGSPGNASDGGSLVTNLASIAALFQAPAGRAGNKGENHKGGARGNPKTVARYHVTGGMVSTGMFSKARVSLNYDKKEQREVHDGKDAVAPDAARTKGQDGSALIVDNPHCWLSTEALQPVFQYLRDLMIAGYSQDAALLLDSYAPALSQAGSEAGDLDVLAWAKAEADELRLRLRDDLDYFGHPNGYTPSYSLGTTIGIHKAEIDLLMGQLLLAYRLEASQKQAKGLSSMMGELRELSEAQLNASAETLGNAQKQALAVRDRIEKELQPAIAKLQLEIESLELRLLAEVRGKLELQHHVRGAIKIAGTLCQLIPVAQPALGKVGNIAALVSDKFVGRDASASDVFSLIKPTVAILGKASDICSLYADAAPKEEPGKDKPAAPQPDPKSKPGQKTAVQDVRKEPRRKSLFTIDEEQPESKRIVVDELADGEFKTIASRDFKKTAKTSEEPKGTDWARLKTVGKSLEPLLKDFQAGAAEFKVPEQEVEAYLNKLKSESTEWKSLAEKIKGFNQQKAKCLLEIEALGLKISACREAITSGAALYFRASQEAIQNGSEISPAVQALSRVTRHRAERTLLRSLYLMVKAHEALLLETPEGIDWRLSQLAEKALQLVNPPKGGVASFSEQTQQLSHLFYKNVAAIRDSLITLHKPGRTLTRQTKLVLTADFDRDAALFAALNSGQKVRIDPMEYGLVKSDEQRARLARISLIDFAFEDHAGTRQGAASALHGRSMDIYLTLASEGAIRNGAQLLWFRSDRTASWSWTCWEKRSPGSSTSPWEIKPSLPSLVDADVLEFLVGKSLADEKLKERRERARSALSMPPLWSALDLWTSFSEDSGDHASAPKLKRLEFLIDYESDNADPDQATLLLRSSGNATGALITCTPDLGGRGDGYAEQMLRIYKKPTPLAQGDAVRLVAPERIGEMRFAGWAIKVNGKDPQLVSDCELSLSMTAHTQVLCRWHRTEQSLLRSTPPRRLQALHATADADSALLDVVGIDEPGTQLQCREDGWRLMQYPHVSGWLEPQMRVTE